MKMLEFRLNYGPGKGRASGVAEMGGRRYAFRLAGGETLQVTAAEQGTRLPPEIGKFVIGHHHAVQLALVEEAMLAGGWRKEGGIWKP